jgi:hypothetical protein
MLTGYFASVEKEKIGSRTIYNSPEAGQKGLFSKAAARSVTRRINARHVCGRARGPRRAE